MIRKCGCGLAIAAVLVWTATAQDAKQIIADASKAMGADALKTVQYSATGLKLDVQRIVPVHYPADNRQVTMSELTRWVGRTSSTQ